MEIGMMYRGQPKGGITHYAAHALALHQLRLRSLFCGRTV
jgi:hypothetical protein